MRGKVSRRGFAHFTNAQRIQESRQRGFFGFFQRTDHVLRRFRSHAVQTGKFARRQTEQICRRFDIFFLDQLIDDFVAHAVNVQRPAGDEMLQRFFTLCTTNQTRRTTRHGFAFDTFNIRMTDRAMRRENHFAGIFRTLIQHHAHHLRDNISGTTDNHGIADTQPKTFDFICVMQRGIADHHARNQNRLQTCDRRDRTSTPYLKLDVFHQRDLFLRREFEGCCPARRTCHKAQRFLNIQRVNFHYHAVNIKAQ